MTSPSRRCSSSRTAATCFRSTTQCAIRGASRQARGRRPGGGHTSRCGECPERGWGISRLWPQLRESPGQGRERGIVSAGCFLPWRVRRSRMCSFPGSMCEWSASAAPPTPCWWRRCPPNGRAGAPDCRQRVGRVHSSYQRSLDERTLGSAGLWCGSGYAGTSATGGCSRRTFVEQVPGLSERHRRSSTGLTGWLRSIAVELGGRPAARLCRRLRVAAGRTRLLRLLTAPPVPDRAPWVLGVDEFAFRKAASTAPCSLMLKPAGSWTCCPTAPPRRSRCEARRPSRRPRSVCRDRTAGWTPGSVEQSVPARQGGFCQAEGLL
ncbi:hypothetical protein SAURM35S_04259 [Streptomyces aurantiogriseus]